MNTGSFIDLINLITPLAYFWCSNAEELSIL